MQCEEWADANSELFKEAHDEAAHKNSYKRKLYELIGASLTTMESFEIFSLPLSVQQNITLGKRTSPFVPRETLIK